MIESTKDVATVPHVLVVEDSPSDTVIVRGMLRKDYTVSEASTLAEAMAVIRAEPSPTAGVVDVILLDLTLPDSEGLETLQSVLAVAACPVVILSGISESSIAEEAVSLGAHDYLLKGQITRPILLRVLLYTLERARHTCERLNLESSLLQSRKLEAVGQLAAGIAHEINTPTQFVSDNTRFVRDALEDLVGALTQLRDASLGSTPIQPSDLKSLLEKCDVEYLLNELPAALDQSLAGLSSITRIVQAMKQFSHPASEEKSSLDLNSALETSMVVASNEWKYCADVVWDLDADLPTIQGLQGELNQVLLNLIVNAAQAVAERVKHGDDHRGQITVRTSTVANGRVAISIEDTGSGIEAKHIQQVFDPFFTTKEVGQGTGQGLAIAYDVVVNKHGGTIDVESSPDRGTAFTVTLPIRGETESSLQ